MNALDAIYNLIKAQTGVVDLVSTRVYREILPTGFNPDQSSILISQSPGNSDGVIEQCNFMIRTFGATQSSAYAIYQAIKDAFSEGGRNGRNNIQITGGPRFLYVGVTAQAEAFRDPDAQWDYTQFNLRADILNQ